MRLPLKANILVVNDRQDQLFALGTALEALQENVIMVRSGEEALRQLLRLEFAVVLLDVHMPGMDGFETAEFIRQRKSSRFTPIIFVTAHDVEDAQLGRSYSLGAVDYIRTPVVPEILRSKVRVFVDLYKKSEALRLLAKGEHQRQLDEAQEKLEAETKRNLFFVLSLDLLAVAGFDGYFKQINPAWDKVFGFSPEELKAKKFYEFVHPEDQTATLEQFEKLKLGAAVTFFENRFRCKGGQYKWLGWTAAPFVADQLIYIFARDITEQKRTQKEICTLNQKLESRINEVTAVNEELEAFNYSISHDLRAPLRTMQGFAELVLEDYGSVLPEEVKDFIRRIIESGGYMNQLLLDLLEYSRLSQSQAGTGPVELESVLNEVIRSIQKEITDKNARIEVQSPLVPVMAYQSVLKEVLSNLMANAMKFVEPGKTPHVRIYTETDNEIVRISVEDNGIGIAPEQQERIFGLFQRLHSPEEFPGTGIGLAIVRKGVQRMGGRIGVESAVGKGSRFWLELASPAGKCKHRETQRCRSALPHH